MLLHLLAPNMRPQQVTSYLASFWKNTYPIVRGELRRRYPKHALVVSIMAPPAREAWQELARRVEDTGCDGLELNFGCPHGMSERGMGAAIGQVPEHAQRITSWVKEAARTPVIVKLTPNVTDVTCVARAAKQGGADAISLINTINSVMGVDLDTFTPRPDVGGRSSHGGYSGPAVKPIALHMAAAVAKDPEVGLPISGMGGISTWRDAAEFILLGATGVQVCTAVMVHGFGIVEDLIDGLSNWLDEKGLRSIADLRGRALPAVSRWEELDLNYQVVASVDQARCVGCGVCYRACHDGAHQSIAARAEHGRTHVEILADRCVGCNLCSLVCAAEGCITMKRRETGHPMATWQDVQRDPAAHPHLFARGH